MGRIFTALSLYLLFVGAVFAQPVFIKEIPVNSTNFVKVNNLVFFISGDSLLRTDGTAGGTIFLKSGFNKPGGLIAFNGLLYFYNDRTPVVFGNDFKELWRSDGTTAGTFLLKKSSDYDLVIQAQAGSNLYFAASDVATGYELYRTNGTVAGTILLKDINPGPADGFAGGAAGFGSNLFFGATDPTHGTELWKTNGTQAGTVLIKDINPGVESGYIVSTDIFTTPPGFVHNQILYFRGDNGVNGIEPWKSDGTAAGTTLLKDIIPGASSPRTIDFEIANNGAVYFMVFYNYQPTPGILPVELWKTNGTSAGTTLVKYISDYGDDAQYHDFLVYKDKVYFFEKFGGVNDNLWVTDGTSAGTNIFFSFITVDGNVQFFEVVGDYMYFYGSAEGYPSALYKSDGTAAGTKVFTRFNSTGYGVFPRTVTKVGNLIFYGDHDGPGYEGTPDNPDDYFQFIQTDGVTVTSIRKVFGGSFIGTDSIVDFNGKVLFTTYNDQFGATDRKKRLWIYDPINITGPSLTLVNASTDQDIRALKDNDTIIYNSATDKITIKATPSKAVGSIVFNLDGNKIRTESSAPYALQGDNNGDFNAWTATYGNHTLVATAYTGSGGTGTVVEEKTIHFLVKQPGIMPPPAGLVFTLINAATDADIRAMKDNDTIVYNSSTDKITIRANPSKAAGSVVFKLDGPIYRIETEVPYALKGDSDGDYNAWPATYGNHTLIATAYSGTGGSGTVVEERTIHFLVKQGTTPPPTSQITFTLINADTDQEIGPLVDGQTIDLNAIGTNALSVRANSTLTGTKSVVFDFNGKTKYKVENSVPYSLFGDNNGNYTAFGFSSGSYTLKATPFTSTNGGGTAGLPLAITFFVTGTQPFPLISTSPNPVTDKMKVAFSDEISETAYVSIYDQTGKEYYSGTHEKVSGEFEVDLSPLNLQSGLYLMKIQSSDGKFKVVRIVKE